VKHFKLWAGTLITFLCINSLTSPSALAQNEPPGEEGLLLTGPQIAQSDPDEAYDPFSDYSEFDESTDEEADINFFRNGRFFTVGLVFGTRGFTSNFDKIYGSGPSFGIMINYFFDLRSALAMGFMTGDHPMHFETDQGSYNGNVSFTSMSFDYKHYVGSQNITRGLADLNPYFLIGFSQWYRTTNIDRVSAVAGSSRDAVMGGDVGLGLEIPLMRKKAFLGIQGSYHYVNFPDENKDFLTDTEMLKKKVTGDIWDGILTLGMNF